jgi:hypothetical protein
MDVTTKNTTVVPVAEATHVSHGPRCGPEGRN